ncbi:phosphotransferase family protein [Streptomyces beijiangensis]|uniref:Phosphotransferase family protein n=1 Tax=Streptomyces beijiangensis TaxID=163361 RepID=A0A939F7Y0_9ACTN|nr:phosphotransferase family protein [Streptomyces beijiangensis]MBO0513284.1 phosphotransferase family protein [Streptomyces beijiangensis]
MGKEERDTEPMGTSPQASGPPGVDPVALRAHLDRALPGHVVGEIRVRRIEGGRSNLTYLLTDDIHRCVLRRPPLGQLPDTAHDMGREYRVLSALADSAVPVPTPVLLCPDPVVIGAPFYVMDHVDGTVYRSAEDLAPLGARRSGAIVRDLLDHLARIHALDPAAVGLADFGRPAGFLARQPRRWKTQLATATGSRALPEAEQLHSRLAAQVPAGAPACLIHGDYRLDNVLIDADDRVAAVLDWELATVGDPLTDVALFLVYYASLNGAMPTDVDVLAAPHPDLPTGASLLARYQHHRPLDLDRLDWYLALAFFKLAVLTEHLQAQHHSAMTVSLLRAGLTALARDPGPTNIPPGEVV